MNRFGRRLLGAVVTALLMVPLTGAFVPTAAGAQEASDEIPTWNGTIEAITHQEFTKDHWWGSSGHEDFKEVFDEEVIYSNLVPLADGYYSGRVSSSGRHDTFGKCSSQQDPYSLVDSFEWSVDRDYNSSPPGDSGPLSLFRLSAHPGEDKYWFAPQAVPVVGSSRTPCATAGFDGWGTRTEHCALGWTGWDTYNCTHLTRPVETLKDENPAPERLVGEMTWTLEDLTGTRDSETTAFSYTVKYDLTRGEVCNSDQRERTVNTAFLARFVSEDNADILRYAWSDLRFCYGPSGVKVIDTGIQDGTRADEGIITTALDLLGQKFKYKGSDAVVTEKLTDGSVEAKVKGGFTFCSQIPLAGPMITKGLKIVAKLVPDWIEKRLKDWGTKKIFSSSLIPDSLKEKIIRKGYNAVLNTIDRLDHSETIVLKELFEAIVDHVKDDFLGLFLGDGVCLPKKYYPWAPEVSLRLFPDGTYTSIASGLAGPFAVVKEF